MGMHMEQIKNEKVYISGFGVRLISVDYKLLRNPINENLEVSLTQNVNIKKLEMNEFTLIAERIVKFKPNDFYELKIVVEIDYKINLEETIKHISNKDDLQDYVSNNMTVFFDKTPVGESISLLIGQITSTFGQYPIITPAKMG